jgi:glycosyltransferase involved in cell wall biosynthesis
MKFSVLIAHFNNADFFVDCFNSLQKQTYENWEAIVLDDASKPEESKKVKEIIAKDNRFKYFENEQNSGVGITKSKLIELATGDICGFVDPDDAILPTAIEKAIFEFKNNSKVVLAYSQFVSCDSKLNPIKEFKSAMQVQNNDPYFFNYPIQIAHFVTFRKDVYEQTEKMNSDLKISEDQDLYLKLYEKGKVKFIDDANYLYRTHDSGISQNENKKKSYDYWGKVIFNAMKRRGLKDINGEKIPEKFSNSDEIFKLLEYQNSLPYRLQKKAKILLQKLS